MTEPKKKRGRPKKVELSPAIGVPLIRTDPRWTDSNYVDQSKLTPRQIEELGDPDNAMSYANVYDPNQYESIVEDHGGEAYRGESLSNIWGEFIPTFYQLEWFKHFNQRRVDASGNEGFIPNTEGTCVIHRRGGKSTGVISTVFAPRCLMDPGLYLHIFPSLTQARGAIWNGMGRITRDMSRPAIPYMDLFPKRYRGKRNNHDMTQEIYGAGGTSIYRLGGARGADGTANHWRGYNPMGVVPDEYGEWEDNIVSEIFDPVLAQNGGFKFAIGTPKGENQFFQSYIYDKENASEKRKAWLLTIDDTYYNDGEPIIPRSFIDEQLRRGADPEIVQQEYYCSFRASASGAWYRYSLLRVDEESRIRDVGYNANYPVYTAWDTGGDGQRAIVFQSYDDYIRIIDLVAMDNVPIGVIMDAVNAKYVVKEHYFPHDGKQRQDAITVFQSRIEGLREKKGIKNIRLVPRTKSLPDSVEVAKGVMERCLFDATKCARLITDLRNYKRKVNKTTNTYLDDHVHDKASHSADAYRTLATAFELGFFAMKNNVNFWGDKRAKIISKVAKFSFGGSI